MTIIGFSGPIGAGKTVGAQYLAGFPEWRYTRYSKVLAQWQSSNIVQHTRPELQDLGWDVMSSRSRQRELNNRLIEGISAAAGWAVDGLRHEIDYDALHKAFGRSFSLIYVDAPSDVRYERLRRAGRFTSRVDFDRADEHPVEQPMRALKQLSIKTLWNATTVVAYRQALDDLIHLILSQAGAGA
jgi:dephospho-CoA kinase